MTEMRRLIDGELDEQDVELLRSALDDAPRGDSRQRLLVSLGVASGVMTAAAAVEGAAAAGAAGTGAAVKAGAGVSAVFVAKWVGVGVAVAGLATGAVAAVSQLASDQDSGVAPSASAAHSTLDRALVPQHAAPQRSSELDPVPEDPIDVSASAAVNASGAVEPAASPSVAAEVGVLDRAREALRAGDSAGATRALDEHGERFAGGALGEEAELLRIEVRLERGEPEAAAAMAQRFLATHPESSHKARVRSLLRRARASTRANVAAFPEEE